MQWLRSFRRMEPISRLILMALFCSILLFSFCFQLSAAIRDGMQTRLFRLLDQQTLLYTWYRGITIMKHPKLSICPPKTEKP